MSITNQKALVTGADGFIGSHLVELLVKEGYQVRALSQYNSFNSWGWLEDISCIDHIEILSGDVRDPHFCKKMCEGVDTVFHLAALIAIPYSYIAPDSYVQTNILGTVNVCKAALDCDVERIIHTSTSEVYGTAKYVPIDESHPLQPQSPYSASKIGADAMALSFHNAFDLPLTVARPFNTFGPRQSARAVIPTIITQSAAGMKRIRLGDVASTRDFNYVHDTCGALLALARSNASIGETINIGSNSEIAVGDALELIRALMQSDVEFQLDEERLRPEGSEVFRLWCDDSKLRELTGFQSSYDLRSGLTATIEWFRNPKNLARYKVDRYNL